MDPKPNQLVTCPFNFAHQVEHYRFQVHLAKCQKQYPNQRISICPFDATHYVKTEELDHHVSKCPQRFMMDTQVYITDDDHRPPVQLQHNKQEFKGEENWDEDNVESYNPLEAKKNALMYNKIKGATKSERSKFRFENSIKYSQAQAQQGSSMEGNGHNE